MSVAENIPDAVTFAYSLGGVLLVIAIVGCVMTLVACACIVSFSGENAEGKDAERATPQPPVTVLKPLHDPEPGLPARLTAFCRQDYGAPVQVLCGLQDRASPAAAVVREMDGVELVVEPRSHGLNRKVSNLINMMLRARYQTLVLSDSDIVVGPGYLRCLTALLAPPSVGAVSCLYYGISDRNLWTRLSALAINAQFLPYAITAVSLGLAKPCCGATVALRRSTLDRIGGLGAVADVLADDHALGIAVREAGYDVVTAPFLVGHRCFDRSLRALIQRQLRVARTIKSIDPIAYAGTIITHPWPLALLALALGNEAGTLVAIAALLARVMLCRCTEWRFDLPRQNYWLIPLQDVIAFGIYVMSFFGTTVHWQGADYRVTAEGNLLEEQDVRGS